MNFTRLLIESGRHALHRLRLSLFRRRVWDREPGAVIGFPGYSVKITDGPNFYMQYKDEFVNRIYHFDSKRPDPVIIDCGSNMGMSILHFKHVCPSARITGFEPDPELFRLLSDNLARNKIVGVRLVNAGLAAVAGEACFDPDGHAGGKAVDSGSLRVRMELLSTYLDEEVDFLKLNIEGAELDVLTEVADAGRLQRVRQLVLEYHGWPGQRQRLGDILNLFEREGYRYLVHDFDAETCAASKPPFRLQADTTWFCLVYAIRNDLVADAG